MDQESLNGFPFSAVINADDAKRAILCSLVSKDIRTVLIQGVSGSAKTTLVRGVPNISGTELVNVPLNTLEGQVLGTLDIEGTVSSGERTVLPGLLERASGKILYGDDANLMDRSVLSTILESSLSRKAISEREGISREYECDVKFIGTMNISEVPMDLHLLDRFDLCVRLGNTDNENDRYEIVKRKTEFDHDPKGFRKRYEKSESEIRTNILNARERIPFVSISDELLGVIAELCSKVGAEGHRGDIALANASSALAALNGRDTVELDDVKEAAGMCLGHRMTEIPEDHDNSSESGSEPSEQNGQPEMSSDNGTSTDERKEEEKEKEKDDGSGNDQEETVFSIGNTFSVIDFTSLRPIRDMHSGKRHGKHGKTISNDSKGRYIRSKSASNYSDLALDASMRAAAPYQKYREHRGLALTLEPGDLRQKVREKKSGASIMFLVDASSSMGARKRMVTVKGAVFSLLQESYKNRDKVGLIAFRKDQSELLLPFTKSVDFAYRKLKEMPTGGTTPLAAALLKAHSEIIKEMKAHPFERYYVVLTTDGRANVPMDGGNAFDDALKAAAFIGSKENAVWIVVDTGTGYPHTDNAVRLCNDLSGIYLKLEELNADTLGYRLKTIIGRNRQ